MNSAPLVLASASRTRREMLRAAGVPFEAQAADIDEAGLTRTLQDGAARPDLIAMALAHAKALEIAQQKPGALVIGADQVLELDGALLDKARTKDEAREKLLRLSGREHRLVSAVCVAQAGRVLWEHTEEAVLKMHRLESGFIDSYCEAAGDALTRSVGAYELESHGAWLFSDVRGDYFTVLGMPLLPLLGYLRMQHGFGMKQNESAI